MKASDIVIRKTNEKDLEEIGRLFQVPKDNSQMRWPLSSGINDGTLKSFVAVTKDNRIVGHIGYVISHYLYHRSKLIGTHPVLWVVSSDYRGSGLGKRLIMRINNCVDLTMLLGGSETARRMSSFFGFKIKLKIFTYFKILDPVNYFKSIDSPFLKKSAKTLFLFFNRLKKIKSISYKQNIDLEKYTGGGGVNYLTKDHIFHNSQDEDHINWILRCPFADSYAFTIKQNNTSIGVAICYISKNKKNILTGRIVHLSYLGDDSNIWNEVFAKIEDFFKERGCSSISTLASYPACIRSLGESGYASFQNSYLPLHLLDRKNILAHIPNDAWHLTFMEGDLCYRGI